MTDELKNAKGFKLQHTSGFAVSDDEILADMRRVASGYGHGQLSARLYESRGSYSHITAQKHFGSWNTALRAAGLKVLNQVNISEEDLFSNIEELWVRLGRQPRKRELVPPMSRYSEGAYRRFGSWRQALEEFIRWTDKKSDSYLKLVNSEVNRKRTSRDPNSALRWRVANRDSFRCQHCGKSPAKDANVELHIDHIEPWSNGGETILENLQTLCSKCNIGKGTQRQQLDENKQFP